MDVRNVPESEVENHFPILPVLVLGTAGLVGVILSIVLYIKEKNSEVMFSLVFATIFVIAFAVAMRDYCRKKSEETVSEEYEEVPDEDQQGEDGQVDPNEGDGAERGSASGSSTPSRSSEGHLSPSVEIRNPLFDSTGSNDSEPLNSGDEVCSREVTDECNVSSAETLPLTD